MDTSKVFTAFDNDDNELLLYREIPSANAEGESNADKVKISTKIRQSFLFIKSSEFIVYFSYLIIDRISSMPSSAEISSSSIYNQN